MKENLGKYEIIAELGEGATAFVYHARDTHLNREVALKVLKPALVADGTAFERFVQEAQAAANLFHPHIAMVLDMEEADGRYYIAMRYIPGKSLDKILEERAFTWDETLTLSEQVGEALDYAHNQGFIHRDIKPSNIILDLEGNYWVTDFGLTKAMMSTGLTSHSGAVLGTPAYIAPEIWQGEEAVPATDQYALACVVHEALTGDTLFRGETPPATMKRHFDPLELPETWPEGIPREIGIVLDAALSKEPDGRYASTGEFAQALSNLARGDIVKDPQIEKPLPESAQPPSDQVPDTRKPLWRRWPLWVGGIILIVLASIGLISLIASRPGAIGRLGISESQTATTTYTATATLSPTNNPTATPTFTITTNPTVTSSPTPIEDPLPTQDTDLEFYDFENQQTTVPNGLVLKHSGYIGNGLYNQIELDNSVAYSGSTSLKFSTYSSTQRWYSIGRQIPAHSEKVVISYYVKGNDIHQEGKQYANCWLGFVFTDNDGNKEFKTNSYLPGSFDWEYGELILDSRRLERYSERGTKVEFLINCMVSGRLWVDDLRIEIFPRDPYARSPETTADETSDVSIELYDFEDQQITVPDGFYLDHSGYIGDGQYNQIGLDDSISYSGTTSLKFYSDSTTERWNSINRHIPTDSERVIISYYVKGNNIHQEGQQYSNCWLGFIFTDTAGNKEFLINDHIGETFDWTYGELILSSGSLQKYNEDGTKIKFLINCMVSGELWVDDLKIEIHP